MIRASRWRIRCALSLFSFLRIARCASGRIADHDGDDVEQYCASVGVTINVPERGSSDGTESSSSAVAEESATSATEEASSSSSSSRYDYVSLLLYQCKLDTFASHSSTTASSSASSSSAMSSSASSSSSTIAPSSSGTVPSAQSTTSTTNTPTSDAESLFAHGHSLVMTSTAILAGAGVAVAIFA